MAEPVFCRNCGVMLRRGFFGNGWRHVMALGPVACLKAEPDTHRPEAREPESPS